MTRDQINVLAVDDEEKNLKLIQALLTHHGYHVFTAIEGEDALKIMQNEDIDVVLLDVMMPGLDGYEVCRRIKEDKKTAHVPVILVTALHEREQKVFGVAAGANDYLTKPIDDEDIVLRVRNAARMKILHDQTKKDLIKLKELEKLRDDLTKMIVHDLRSPLTGILGNLDLLDMAIADKASIDSLQEFVEAAQQSSQTVINMIDALQDVYNLEQNQITLNVSPVHIDVLVQEAVDDLAKIADESSVEINAHTSACTCECDAKMIKRVVANLLSNAIKYTPPGQEIQISTKTKNGSVLVHIEDNSPGIPDEYHDKVFEKFGQVRMRKQNQKHSTGLGLTFCKLAVEAHGGDIGVKNKNEHGSIFWFEIPLISKLDQS